MKLTNCERAVLKHIKFWQPKAKTLFEGKKWIIQTAEEIQTHLANSEVYYERDTIWRALRSLKRKGLIDTAIRPHPFIKYLRTANWLRLEDQSQSGVGKNPSPEAEKIPVGSGKKSRSIYTENITENIQKLYQGEEASSSQEKMGNDMVELPEEKYQGFGSKGKGAKAILDKFNKVKSETDLRIYPCTPITFFNFYKSVYAKHHGYIGEVSNPVLI